MIERLLLLFDKYPLDFISGFGGSLSILVGLIRYKYLTRSLKIILLFFLMYLIGDIYTIWLGLIKSNNLFILNLYPILGMLLLSASYFHIITSVPLKKFILTLAGLLSLICLIFFEYDSVSTIEFFVYKIYIMIVVLIHFNDVLSNLRVKNILLYSMFWISAALIIYAMGTFFTSLFSEVIFDATVVNDATFDRYWNLNNILFIIMVLLSSIGLWVSKCDRENLI